MRIKFVLTIAGLMILFCVGNYYIGLRFWQCIGSAIGAGWAHYYWILFALITGTYFWGRIGAIYFPGDCSDKLIWFGSYWCGVSFYLCLLWLLYDMGIAVARLLGFLTSGVNYYSSFGAGVMILLIASGGIVHGIYNAWTAKVNSYDITIGKQVGDCRELHVVMISDLHLGLLVGTKRLRRAVQMINELDPDLVLMPGDIIDENIGAFVENGMPEILCGIRSRLGVFGVLGSHEYIYGHAEKAITYLQRSGVKILRDDWIQLPNGVYLAGRDDLFKEQLTGTPRQKLSNILTDCKRECPIILMDHQPVALAEAELQGVDLQLSGHTHHGQLFPLNILTPWLFEKDWGYLRKGRYQLIVSSGYGTWGPPIRLRTSSEIVDIRIKFTLPV